MQSSKTPLGGASTPHPVSFPELISRDAAQSSVGCTQPFSLLARAVLALRGPAALQSCSCGWSKSSPELMLTWAPGATVLAAEAAAGCAVGSRSSSYWGSSSSDGGPSSERYGGGGRSNHGGRLREETKREAPGRHQHSTELGKPLWGTEE